jgi:serine/threonine-protein kinase
MSSESAATGSRRSVRIGKYEVLAHIATGGMGAVYRALDTEENREVALKVLTPEMAARPAMLERFRREGRHAVKMRHENIVTVYEYNEINGTFYIAMEFVDGIDLHDYIDQKNTLDPEESRQMMLQAARALAHAHHLGIVHRDIKPSNFLVTRKNNRVVIKLTDLGLARETQADEFRVTRAGTTVGTVDYIAPEQARDSGAADIRSDIYSLGCTWFHMLAGRPPFPDGGLAERLYKHMEAEPPDIRELNPRASNELAAVLNKMLAKKPSDRYQNPTELLQALNEMTAVARPAAKRETVAETKMVTSPDTGLPARKPPAGFRKQSGSVARKKSGSAETEKAAARRAAERRRRLAYAGAIAAAVLVVVGVALAVYLSRPKPSPVVVPAPPSVDPVKDGNSPPEPLVIKPPEKDPSPPVTPPTRFKQLYKPNQPIDAKQLRTEIEKPWAAAPTIPENAPVLRVSRVPDAAADGLFGSLTEAFTSQAASAAAPLVIEISDNGPIYSPGHVFKERHVVLRAGKGYRPLLVWDLGLDNTFIKVLKGSLTLENIDIAVRIPEATAPARRWTLFHVADGAFTATGCTFSETGKAPDAVVLTRFEGSVEGSRCRFTRCYARGQQLVALDLNAPAAEVLFDGCLVVGGDQALVQVAAGMARPPHLAVVRSTLIGSQTLMTVCGTGAGVDEPALRWFGWDALLSRAHKDAGGTLLALAPGCRTKGILWEAVNCLYAGWDNLLVGPQTITASKGRDQWCELWALKEGDGVRRDMWPLRENVNVETYPAEEYRPSEKCDVGVASTLSGDLPIGCDVDALPPARKEWVRLVPDQITPPPTVSDSGPPKIPDADGQAYVGERVDIANLNPPDIGVFLQHKLRERQKFAPKVVLRLYKTEKADVQLKFTPFTVPAGSSLAIYYEPKGDKPEGDKPEDRQPLKVEVLYQSADAFLATEDGALELTNLELSLQERSPTFFPPVLLKVRGDLRLHRCRLVTADKKTPSGLKALIDFHGSGEEAADKPARTLTISQSVLLSYTASPTCVRVFGPGARLHFQQALLVAAGDGVSFDFAPEFKARANVQCWLQNCTLAVRRSAVVFNNAPSAATSVEPVFVRSSECAFVNPFPGKHTPGVVLFQEGAPLSRGLFLWQSDGDAFDKRLHYLAASSTLDPSRLPRQDQVLWPTLWGSANVRELVTDADWAKLTFGADPWVVDLDRLEAPPVRGPGMKERTVGVKIADLGIVKRKR